MRSVSNLQQVLLNPLLCVLEHHPSITRLNLEDNFLGPDGVEALGKALRKNKSLTYLSLFVEAPGAIFDGLRKNRTLRTLKLALSDISRATAASFAVALARNSCLQRVELDHCKISREGHMRIVEGLKFNSTLALMVLRNIDRTYEGGEVLKFVSTNGIKAKVTPLL
jgi:Ran GTPase-activating protein (RanGAP) involved in mRNA processing and transport